MCVCVDVYAGLWINCYYFNFINNFTECAYLCVHVHMYICTCTCFVCVCVCVCEDHHSLCNFVSCNNVVAVLYLPLDLVATKYKLEALLCLFILD